MKLIVSLILIASAFLFHTDPPSSIQNDTKTRIQTGAEQTSKYLPFLKGKRVAMLANQTTIIGKKHLVDSLQTLGIHIVKVFGPEHGSCFENYLFHPDNLETLNQTLKLDGFSKSEYIKEIVEQKNLNKTKIILNLKKSRDSYHEFRIDAEKVRVKDKEDEIISNLDSDNLEIFFKSFSLKDYYNKNYISRYGLTNTELANTKWFKNRMIKLLEI